MNNKFWLGVWCVLIGIQTGLIIMEIVGHEWFGLLVGACCYLYCLIQVNKFYKLTFGEDDN